MMGLRSWTDYGRHGRAQPQARRWHHRRMSGALYDGSADWYDDEIAPFTLYATASIRRLFAQPSGRCLDLGCGTGLHLRTLVELGWSVVGVDISGDQLRRAKERMGEEVELVEAD